MASPKYILALDQGTTSSRAILFDHRGRPAHQAQRELTPSYPRPGWVEQDPEEIWTTQHAAAAEVLEAAGVDASEVAAIGIANQRETVVVWDRASGKPLHPAIVWQDRRTADRCRELKKAGHEPLFREKTGLLLDPYFSGTKIAWILDQVEGARARAERGEVLFGTVDTWLMWKLTAGAQHLTDVTNASRTLLFNLHDLTWDDALLELLGIPRAMLPAVRPSSEVYADVAPRVFPLTAPLAGIAGDQQAALFGQACFEPGVAKNTYGTGCFLLLPTGPEAVASPDGLLTTIACTIGDQTEYALEGSIFVAGAVVQWLRDELQLIESAAQCDALAATVPDAGGLFLVPAFTGLGAPHWDPYARGAAFGMTRGTNRAHLCRAALESIAFQSFDLAEAMIEATGQPLKELRVDGGASRSDPLMQFQADLLQRPVVRPRCVETTALGAAYLAGLAVGFWKDRAELADHWEEAERFTPRRTAAQMAPLRDGWNRAVARSREWIESASDASTTPA